MSNHIDMLGRPIEIGNLVVASTGHPSQGQVRIMRVKRMTPKMVGCADLIDSKIRAQLKYGTHLVKIEEDIVGQAVLTGNITEKGLLNHYYSV